MSSTGNFDLILFFIYFVFVLGLTEKLQANRFGKGVSLDLDVSFLFSLVLLSDDLFDFACVNFTGLLVSGCCVSCTCNSLKNVKFQVTSIDKIT